MTGWIIASFAAGFIPAALLVGLYGFRTDWWKSFTGRVLFGLIITTAISYGFTIMVLVWPDFWNDDRGELIRVIVRFVVAAVLWGLLAVFVRAQRRGRRAAEEVDPV